MAIDQNFLMTEILKLNTAVAGISGKIDGFLQSQLGMQTEISGIKSRPNSGLSGSDHTTRSQPRGAASSALLAGRG